MAHTLRGLYMIIDPAVAGERDVLHVAREAIAGGAAIVQWRDKTREKGLQLADVRTLADICREAGLPLIVNDHVDLALAAEADGVHVGQRDLPVAVARRLVPDGWIVGASTNDADEARAAEADGADYVSVGNLFGTTSKDDTRPATLDTLAEVKAAVRVPVCAIGGIDEANIAGVVAAGADMAAVISAVTAADDPRAAAQRLAAAFG
ncbi:MAG: thiamine phosphate synthase [Chloroflexi bacterium]|nr:thiamine phosphate synthase [Chloroflexota bacterium]